MDEEIFGARCGTQILFAQQPDLGSEPTIAPLVGGRHAQRGEPSGPRAIGSVAPRHAAPRLRGRRRRHGVERHRPRLGREDELRPRPPNVWSWWDVATGGTEKDRELKL